MGNFWMNTAFCVLDISRSAAPLCGYQELCSCRAFTTNGGYFPSLGGTMHTCLHSSYWCFDIDQTNIIPAFGELALQ